jgi:O-antigen/teichoic acid export membrane protein
VPERADGADARGEAAGPVAGGAAGAGEEPAGGGCGGAPARSVVRASIWTIGGFGIGQVLRLGGNLVLTRLLYPEVFGLSALVSVFLQGLWMLTDVGMGPAIVQSPRGEAPRFLATAWTIQIIRGGVLFLAAAAVAWPAAALYGQPLLRWLLPVAGLNVLVSGFDAISWHVAQRRLQLGRLTLVELVSQAGALVAMVGLAAADRAVYGPNHPGAVWSVIAGGIVASVVRLVLSHTVLPRVEHRLLLDPEARRALLRFGGGIFVSSTLFFLAGQADRLLFGRMLAIDVFGVYNIAAMLAMLPTAVIQTLGSRVLFPAYSRLAGQEGFGEAFRRARLPMLLLGAAAVSAMIACGPELVRLLYDARYAQAGWILQFLAVAAWFTVLETTNGSALLAQARVSWHAADQAVKLLLVFVLVPVGIHLDGFRGALVALVLADLGKYLASAVGVALRGLQDVGRDLVFTLLIAGSAAAGAVTGEALDHRAGRLAGFLGAAAVAGGAWAVTALFALRRARLAQPVDVSSPATGLE